MFLHIKRGAASPRPLRIMQGKNPPDKKVKLVFEKLNYIMMVKVIRFLKYFLTSKRY